MLKKFYIAMLALATFVLVVMPFIPHHHHDSVACTFIEHCEHDNADNDKHTNHSDDGTKCFGNGSYISSVSQLVKKKADVSLFSLLFCSVVSFIVSLFYPMRIKLFVPLSIGFSSVSECLSHGLRAPPCF